MLIGQMKLKGANENDSSEQVLLARNVHSCEYH